MQRGLRGGSGVQQHIQPRLTDNKSGLLKLVVVQDEWGNNDNLKTFDVHGQ